jgi:hypothetical protein
MLVGGSARLRSGYNAVIYMSKLFERICSEAREYEEMICAEII